MAQNDTITETTETTAATPADATPPGEQQADQGTPPAEGDKPAASDAGGDILDSADDDGVQPSADGDVLADADSSDDEGVPDSYTFDLSDEMAEKGIKLDEATLEAFKATAKDMGLSQKQFEGLVEYDLGRTQEAMTFWSDRVQGWRDSAKVDKEFGGENYQANVKAVAGLINQFGDAEAKAMLKSPTEDNPDGLAVGNHPAFLRMMNRIAKKLGDPSLILGDDVTVDDSNEAKLKRMYPSMYKADA